jgi:starch phosphorylase
LGLADRPGQWTERYLLCEQRVDPLIFSSHFNRSEPGVFEPIRHALLEGGDHYRHLADLADYARAHAELDACYLNPEAWSRKAIINVACSGKFSSDRTIREYAQEIWNLKESPVS